MPTYEYRCEKCRAEFTATMSMAEHDRTKVKCPACQSSRVVQQFSTFYAQTSKKS
jgi:putative FmdB family regulatory protein